MKQLYQTYGELMIQMEILDSQIKQVKQQIADELNKQVPPHLAEKPKEKADEQS